MRCRNLLTLGLLLLAPGVRADVSLPAVFGTNMVLQQDVKIPVWGWADPGELVQVSLGDQQLRTKADAKGDWRVEFPPMPASDKPRSMAIAGRNGIQFDNVLVGEVWLAAGSTNMSYQLHDSLNGDDAAAKANDPMLRMFNTENHPGIRPKTVGAGYWMPIVPKSPTGSSAVAYYFGEQLRQKLNRPIGVIVVAWPGQWMESFMSREALAKIPGHEKELADVAAQAAVFPTDPAAEKAAIDDWGRRINDWQNNQNVPWMKAENDWAKARDAAVAAKQPVPPEPVRPPPPPRNPDGEPDEVTTLFNGMIAPLIGFPIQGVVWYGDDDNVSQAQYETLLHALVDDWRARWKSDLDFLIVGLANDGPRYTKPENSGRAEVRAAQIAVASGPKTGLAQTIDIGTTDNGNPPDKLDVGNRLVATALHVAYGQNVAFEGPRFVSMAVEGNKIRVKYANGDGGLLLAPSPYISTAANNNNPPLPLSEPLGFEVAGADKKWVAAKARIDGSTMLVWSDAVTHPVAVRYAWSSNPPVNLYSKDGFPAVPFRTQDWPATP